MHMTERSEGIIKHSPWGFSFAPVLGRRPADERVSE